MAINKENSALSAYHPTLRKPEDTVGSGSDEFLGFHWELEEEIPEQDSSTRLIHCPKHIHFQSLKKSLKISEKISLWINRKINVFSRVHTKF